MLLDSGASMEDVKERLGHSNISTTLRPVHFPSQVVAVAF
ncbi:MAG: hypothetical protein LKH34_05300 [Lactobacillus sp.]|nr:hypothetical protein [Lactobacillus sp.]